MDSNRNWYFSFGGRSYFFQQRGYFSFSFGGGQGDYKMVNSKKGQSLVLDTNVKIIIVIVVVVLVLLGIFFFGEKLFPWYENFVPEESFEERFGDMYIPFEERANYDYGLDSFSGGTNNEFVLTNPRVIKDLLLTNTILQVNRYGVGTIVKSNFSSYEDANPFSEKVSIVFPGGISWYFKYDADMIIDLYFDAYRGKVFGEYFFRSGKKRSVTYILYCLDEKKAGGSFNTHKLITGKEKEPFDLPKLNDEEKDSLGKIICSENFSEFVSNIVDGVRGVRFDLYAFGRFNCKLIVGDYELRSTPGKDKEAQINYLSSRLTRGRPNYVESWSNGSIFANGGIDKRYLCLNKNSGEFEKCIQLKEDKGEPLQAIYDVSYSIPESDISYTVPKNGDEIYYVKGNEIWKMIISHDGREFKNYCYKSLINGEVCK